MKKLTLLFFVSAFAISSCNNIPEKTIFEKLSVKELSKIIKSNEKFTEFYEEVRKLADVMSDVKKAVYIDITYKRLFKDYMFRYENTDYWFPLYEEWDNEWQMNYGLYIEKADSVLNYWNDRKGDKTMPSVVKRSLYYEGDSEFMLDYMKADLIKELLNQDFISNIDYRFKKEDEIMIKRDKLCNDFWNEE